LANNLSYMENEVESPLVRELDCYGTLPESICVAGITEVAGEYVQVGESLEIEVAGIDEMPHKSGFAALATITAPEKIGAILERK